MRLLLLSDIHGKFGLINELASSARADAVIVAGDLQLESHDRLEGLNNRELFLRIKHSPLREMARSVSRDDRAGLERLVLEHRLCGEWDEVLAGRVRLEVPVYAVWGNHEDAHFVRLADAGELDVPNLYFLNGARDVLLDGWVRLSGIGGNLLRGDFLGSSIITPAGKITAILERYARVYERWQAIDGRGELRVFVQHVSPHKDRACANPLLHIAPTLVVSGHMGAPYPQQGNLFGLTQPWDHEILNAPEAERAGQILDELVRGAETLAAIEVAEGLLDRGPDELEAWLGGEGEALAGRLSSCVKEGIADRRRRYSVALDKLRRSVGPQPEGSALERLQEIAFLLDPPSPLTGLASDVHRRHGRADALLRRIGSINLPDAHDGHVVLDLDRSGESRIESFGRMGLTD